MSKITDLPDKPSFQLVEIFSWFAFGELISATDLQRRIKEARERQYSQLRGVAEPDSIIRHCEAIPSGEFSATQLSEDGLNDDDLAIMWREHRQFLGWINTKWAGDYRRPLIRARTWALLQHRNGASLQLISNRCRALHVDGTIELRGIEMKDGKALTGEHSLIPPEYSLRPWILDIEGGRAELYPVAEGPLSLEAIFADIDRRTHYIESVILREHALALLSCVSRDADRSVGGSGHAARTRPGGRPVGAGSYDYLDAPIVESILATMAAQPGLSAAQATREYPGGLPGSGTRESREKRITRKVRGAVQSG